MSARRPRPLLARIVARVHRDLLRLVGRAAPAPHNLLYVVPATREARLALPAGVRVTEVDAAAVRAEPDRYAGSVLNATASLAHGHRCFVARLRGEVVYRMWVADADAVRSMYPAGALPVDAVWAYGCFTLPSARGGGVYPAAIAWLAAHGRAIAMQVTSENETSQRSVVRAGGVLVGTRAIFE